MQLITQTFININHSPVNELYLWIKEAINMGSISRVGKGRSSKDRRRDQPQPGLRPVGQIHAGGKPRRIGT